MNQPPLTAALMIRAYAAGVFPMAHSADDPGVFWLDPEKRGIIPLDGFHISRSLRRVIKAGRFDIRTDTAFDQVVNACADRKETWINASLRRVYASLHSIGMAHSVECWREGKLVGGVFGISLAGAFCGESMFSRETDASKVALAALVARLRGGGYALFDTQFLTPHLASLGGLEIPRDEYHKRLKLALEANADFYSDDAEASAGSILHFSTQIS